MSLIASTATWKLSVNRRDRMKKLPKNTTVFVSFFHNYLELENMPSPAIDDYFLEYCEKNLTKSFNDKSISFGLFYIDPPKVSSKFLGTTSRKTHKIEVPSPEFCFIQPSKSAFLVKQFGIPVLLLTGLKISHSSRFVGFHCDFSFFKGLDKKR